MNSGCRCISLAGKSGGGTSTSRWMVPGFADMMYTRSPRYTASSMEWVMKKTVACASRQRFTSRSCMWRRVDGSSAPKGSSIRMMRGFRINVRAIATRWRMPPESSSGYFCASRSTDSPTRPIHSAAASCRFFRGTPRHSSPKAMLSMTVRFQNEV